MTGGLLANERPAAPLERCLHELFESHAAQIVSQARLKEHVHRVLVDVDGIVRRLGLDSVGRQWRQRFARRLAG